jgi:putative ABC transport system permease protein
MLFTWLMAGEARAHPLRTLIAVLAIATGVALGLAVNLINRSALAEFAAAVRATAGSAELELRGIGLAARLGFDEAVLERVLRSPMVAAASPVLELEAAVLSHAARSDGRREVLRVYGLDPLRARAITPGLVGRIDPALEFEAFDPRAIFLSPAALAHFDLETGDRLQLQQGLEGVEFVVAGTLPGAGANQRLAVIDIAAAQWRFERLGRLSRIDLDLAPGVSPARLRRELALPSDVVAVEPEARALRASNLSRAYRVNLNVLALVALVTGAFLVFSVQALAIARRRAQFALVRVCGAARRRIVLQGVGEGVLLGVLGSALGVAAAAAIAALALALLGGDLGGGYFEGSQPVLDWSWPAAALYAALGVFAAVLGSALPARAASHLPAARVLKGQEASSAGDTESSIRAGLIALALAALLALAPPIGGLALGGYAAVAALLAGGIVLMPACAAALARALAAALARSRSPVLLLAVQRVANAPREAGVMLSGVLASFSLLVAMAVMVSSFRQSVDAWLGAVLPADLYLRAATAVDTAFLPPATQHAIAALPGIARVEFSRSTQLALDPARPNVGVLVRDLATGDPAAMARALPLIGPALVVSGRPLYVTEAMVDLHGYSLGREVVLPLGAGGEARFVVAGIWRDYARQFGAVALAREDFLALGGDTRVTDAALWLADGTDADALTAALRALPGGEQFELASAASIRALSLRIFDRSFAVTYLLEAVAILIGLAGVAAGFGQQALARLREFGMLRHLGLRRRELLAIVALEGVSTTAVGVLAGFAVGLLVSLVLIHVINPQSFHWTMGFDAPWLLLAGVSLALLLAAAAAAVAAGRQLATQRAVLAVREDW